MEPSSHRGPPLLVVGGAYVLLFLAGLVIPGVLTGGDHIPSPFLPAEASARYFIDHAAAAQIGAFIHFGSAVPLGVFAASATSRVQFLGIKFLSGLNIALFGGCAAAILLAISAAVGWALALSSVDLTTGTIHALHCFQFVAGGPGYTVAFGLFVAGLALTAGLQGFAPRWLMFAGLGIAAAAEVSWIGLVVPRAAILLPIARFTGFVWILVVAAILPRTRAASRATPAVAAVA